MITQTFPAKSPAVKIVVRGLWCLAALAIAQGFIPRHNETTINNLDKKVLCPTPYGRDFSNEPITLKDRLNLARLAVTSCPSL